MGGKYEVRFYIKDDGGWQGYNTVYTNSWVKFMLLRLTKKCIYYKVFVR